MRNEDLEAVEDRLEGVRWHAERRIAARTHSGNTRKRHVLREEQQWNTRAKWGSVSFVPARVVRGPESRKAKALHLAAKAVEAHGKGRV